MKTRLQLYCVLTFLLLGLSLRARAVEPALEQILDNGPVDNRINLVFLSEGFTEDELDTFVYHARSIYLAGLLNTPPFSDYKNYFNAFVIRVASAESGSDHPSRNIYRDTYFNSSYENNNFDGLLEIPPNSFNGNSAYGQDKVRALLKAFDLEHAIPILIVNDEAYGGSGEGFGLQVTVVSRHSLAVPLLLHELGHSLASLGDEYATTQCNCYPREHVNTTREYRREFIPWRHWIDASTPIPTFAPDQVGLFEGAEYQEHGWFRPQLHCIMQNIYDEHFCAVCSEALVREFHKRVQQVEESTPDTGNLKIKGNDSVRFAVTLLDPESHELKIQWLIDEQPVAVDSLEFTLNAESLAGGVHTVLAVIADDTPLVRDDPTGLLTTTLAWKVTVTTDTAQLTVKPIDAQSLLLHVTGPAGRRIAIESSENLINWQMLTEVANATGTLDLLVNIADQTTHPVSIQPAKNLIAGRKILDFVGRPGPAGLQRFYRATVLEP